MNTLIQKYGAALLPAAITLFGALQVVLQDDVIDEVEGGQLIALVATLVVTYLVPLTNTSWAGVLKTGAAILGAVATLIIPLFNGGADWNSIIVVALAVLNALATEIGVQARVTSPAEAQAEVVELDAAQLRTILASDDSADNDDLVLEGEDVINKTTGEKV